MLTLIVSHFRYVLCNCYNQGAFCEKCGFFSGVREQRLLKIRDQMVAQAPNTRVHFEMASFVEAELLYQLTQFIIPYADSLGMNEQVKHSGYSNGSLESQE